MITLGKRVVKCTSRSGALNSPHDAIIWAWFHFGLLTSASGWLNCTSRIVAAITACTRLRQRRSKISLLGRGMWRMGTAWGLTLASMAGQVGAEWHTPHRTRRDQRKVAC